MSGGTLFEELGFFYLGPIDGHNFNQISNENEDFRSKSGNADENQNQVKKNKSKNIKKNQKTENSNRIIGLGEHTPGFLSQSFSDRLAS